jgi:hypothetical protein
VVLDVGFVEGVVREEGIQPRETRPTPAVVVEECRGGWSPWPSRRPHMIQSVPKVSEVQPPNRGRERIEISIAKEAARCLRAADFAVAGQTVKGSQGKLVHVMPPDE